MAKVSAALRAFNAGEFSSLMDGRTDLDRYPASMKTLFNAIAAPQGPFISRSGTTMMGAVYDEEERSALLPFVFSDDQALMLEFSPGIVRFMSDAGLIVRASTDATALGAGPALELTSPGHGVAIGEQITFSGFPASAMLNGEVALATNVVGDVVTTDRNLPVGLVYSAGMKIARVYEVVSPYDADDLANLRFVQSLDVLFLFCDGKNPRKLSRFGAYAWTFSEFEFIDGPYGPTNDTSTRLYPSASGEVGIATSTYTLAASQSGTIEYLLTAPTAVTGYTIYIEQTNTDTTYAAVDHAPQNWFFEGSPDGVSWTILDQQVGYVLYDNYRSVFFPVKNEIAFAYYRLNIKSVRRNGPIKPAVNRTVLASKTGPQIGVTASAVTGINRNQGFLPTDVGRLIRYKSSDGTWAALIVEGWIDATSILARPQSAPLSDTFGSGDWRLGLYSETSGFPTCGTFFEDRLYMAGAFGYPDTVAGSQIGRYENFTQTTETGQVLDESAIVATINARKLSRVTWLATDERGLLAGTGAGEFVIQGSDREAAITARNIRARNSTIRGSAPIEPVKVDRQVLYVQRSRRSIREFAYVLEADGYKSPSMSLFASHIGTTRFAEMDYAAEPHSIIWVRREDGKIAGLTYNREENVIGWHVHDFGGHVESLAVIPSADGLQDTLWMTVRREIGGETRRFIERLNRFWDFDMSLLTQAHYVDCGLRYSGVPVSVVYAPHLDGQEVVGLVDGGLLSPRMCVDGVITLDSPASEIVVGIGYESLGITSRLEAGAADGTAQGKTKRIHKATIRLWQSAGGFVGREDAEDGLQEIEMRQPDDPINAPIELHDRDELIEWPNGYDTDGRVVMKRPATSPVPFNVVAIYPHMHTQDA